MSSSSSTSPGKIIGLGPNVWKVEKIVGERSEKFGNKVVTEFEVKWEGYDKSQNTWESAKRILDKSLITEWRVKHPSKSDKDPLPKKSRVTKKKKVNNVIQKVSKKNTANSIPAVTPILGRTRSSTKVQSTVSGTSTEPGHIPQILSVSSVTARDVTLQIINLSVPPKLLIKEKVCQN